MDKKKLNLKLSVTLQYALRYFTVIAAIAVAIFLMVGWILQQYEQFAVDSVKENVEDFMQELDSSILKQSELAQEIFMDDLTSPGNINNHTLQTIKGIKQLKLYKETLMLNDYLFLHYPVGRLSDDLILYNGTISHESFMEYELKLEDESKQLLTQMLNDYSSSSSAILTGRTGENLFVWSYPFKNTFSRKRGIISFGIKSETWERYLHTKVFDMPFYATVVDDSNRTLFEINEFSEITAEKAEEIKKSLINGEAISGYFTDIYDSINGFTFYIVLDDSYVLSEVRQIVYIVLFWGVVIIIAAVCLLLIVNHFHIKQIRQVRDDLLKLQEKTGEQKRDGNEFLQMHDLIANIYMEQSRKTKERYDRDRTMWDVIANLLLSGKLAQREDILTELVGMFCPKLHSQYYAVMGVITAENCDEFLERLELDDFLLICKKEPNNLSNIRYLIMGIDDEDTDGTIRRNLSHVLLEKAHRDDIEMIVVSGKVYDSLNGICDSYRDVLQLTNVLLAGKEEISQSVFVYEECLWEKANTALTEEERANAIENLTDGTYDMAVATIELLFEKALSKKEKADFDFALHCLAMLLEDLFREAGVEEGLLLKLKDVDNLTPENLKKCAMHMISGRKPESNDAVDAILNYINENFRDNSMGLDTLAAEFNMSVSSLSRRIRESIGENYSDYIFRIRLEEACRLLRETQISVRDIPNEVGYSDYSSFSRKFKARMGVTLKEYRVKEQTEQ